MYRCVLDARNAIIAAMKPGVTIASLQDVAAAVYAKHGYAKEFEASGRYIGHFVGIAVHDVIDIVGSAAQKPFVAGTVFNVEPILEFPDRKIHIRLEDTVIVTETGAENLTAGVPAEVEPLYGLIRQRGVNSLNVGGARALTGRAARAPMRRRGGSRSRTAWPRPREPGTAGYCCPARVWMRGGEKGCAPPAPADSELDLGHARSPSSARIRPPLSRTDARTLGAGLADRRGRAGQRAAPRDGRSPFPPDGWTKPISSFGAARRQSARPTPTGDRTRDHP